MANVKQMFTVLGVEARAKESKARYNERLAKAVADAKDDVIAKLPDEAKAYLRAELNLEINGEGKAAPAPKAETPKADAQPAKKEKAAPAPKAEPAPKADKLGKIKTAVFNNPQADADTLLAMLAKDGITTTKSTVQTVRADFIHSMRTLIALGADLATMQAKVKKPEPAAQKKEQAPAEQPAA
jgi:hypothetical protein